MKIIEWFKKLFKKDYMLNEGNIDKGMKAKKNEFVPKVDINTEHKRTREDVIRSLNNDMIIEDLSEQYNYTKFSPENIREKYDADSVLSDEDMTAISCLFGAIKDGNMWHTKSEIVNDELKLTNNRINDFLKESPENIVILINLMEKSAKDSYESLGNEKSTSTTVQSLIPGSYDDISQLIEEYTKESEIEER